MLVPQRLLPPENQSIDSISLDDSTKQAFMQAPDTIHLHHESFFQELLVFERKRSERSNRPFILMSMDVEHALASGRNKPFKKALSRILHSTTRDIDVKGWLEQDKTVGIIYTETKAEDRPLIISKMLAAVQVLVPPPQSQSIHIHCRVFPEESGLIDDNGLSADPHFYPETRVSTSAQHAALIAKRSGDVFASILLIILLSPFFILIPALIRLDSKGPVLYRQKRIGLNGQIFTMYKFRTMRAGNDASEHQRFMQQFIKGNVVSQDPSTSFYHLRSDSRVTRMGKFLRKTSLDELPQLLNVCWGTMSLVGPRPPILYEVREYDSWHRRRVLEAKPGITGIWQVQGRSKTPFAEMCRMDLHYVKNWSLFLDLKLLIMTPLAVIQARGAA